MFLVVFEAFALGLALPAPTTGGGESALPATVPAMIISRIRIATDHCTLNGRYAFALGGGIRSNTEEWGAPTG
ncbi:hypothetical protein LJR164_002639 [Phenylobacterium sp. LjRoot164]|uniref:hypothetical protein n=1 Tax=unclassified Phenylobacterium TaxID=2640670 RepID=UPI003ECDF9CE